MWYFVWHHSQGSTVMVVSCFTTLQPSGLQSGLWPSLRWSIHASYLEQKKDMFAGLSSSLPHTQSPFALQIFSCHHLYHTPNLPLLFRFSAVFIFTTHQTPLCSSEFQLSSCLPHTQSPFALVVQSFSCHHVYHTPNLPLLLLSRVSAVIMFTTHPISVCSCSPEFPHQLLVLEEDGGDAS